ncbi:MAG: hypothetical protein JNM31_10870 [Flavobacteriales bacterium]|nr:hypothetical protein [Flavobacteriales bacterium]
MKHLLITTLLAVTFITARAQDQGFGLGIMVGEPTGISGKLWLGGSNALAMGLAWGGLGQSGGYFHVHTDYLFHNFSLIPVSSGKLPLHYGPGVRMRFWNDGYEYKGKDRDFDLGVRLPVGLTYMFDEAPVDIFFELVPSLSLIPDTSFDLDFALGARYWFR